jgi:sugar transferase EpsL
MIKRMMDVLFLVALSPIATPVILLTAIVVLVTLGRPIFFYQPRGGLNGCTFNIWKFRSMTNERGADGQLLPDSRRLTKLGSFLRSTSLDELPCLWNLVRGDVSLVGPRPFIAQYLPLYNHRQMRRHNVRPGITGWAQINGRNALSWEEKFELDLWYVENHSLWLDLRILVMTLVRVIRRSDISAESHDTMPYFTGTSTDRKDS